MHRYAPILGVCSIIHSINTHFCSYSRTRCSLFFHSIFPPPCFSIMATAAPPAKKSQGRKKIEMKLVKKKSSRMVTFSKRRVSIFGKASELSTLCGAQVAVMIFSPGGKIYSFGHPSVEAVVERFESALISRPNNNSRGALPRPSSNNNPSAAFMRMAEYKAEKSRRLKMELDRILEMIEAEKEKRKMLEMVWERDYAKQWWNAPVKEMDLARCEEMEKRLLELKMKVDSELKSRNQQAPPDHLTIPSCVGHDLVPNRSVFPSNFGRNGWIDFTAHDQPLSYKNNAANASHLISFGGSTSNFVPPPASSSVAGVVTTISHSRKLHLSF